MITLEDRLHETSEDLRRSAQRVPDRGMPVYRRAVPLRARWAIAALAVAALVALPIWLGAFEASTEDPALGGESMGDLEIMRSETDVIAFLDDTLITLDEALKLVEEIREWEGVARVAYVSRGLALVEYRELFADQPSMVAIVESDPSILPGSIRLVLTDGTDAEAIGARLEQIPGVFRAYVSGEDTQPSEFAFDILIELSASVTEAEGQHIADELPETWPAVEEAIWMTAEEARDWAITLQPPEHSDPSIDHFHASIRVKLYAGTEPLQRRQTAAGISDALGDRAVGVTLSPDETDDPNAPTTGPEADPSFGALVELVPIRVECTSELPAFPCSALIDGDPTTSWRAPNGGIGAELTFYFQPAVQISHLTTENLRNECQFMRNARVRSVEVEINDTPWLRIQNLEDTNATSQEITVDSTHTSRLVMKITSAHASSSCDGQQPFVELALQGVTFFGRVAPGG